MVGTINSKSLLPKLAVMMLTDITNLPADLTQETSLNGKYVKGIPTAVTDPNAANGSANHTHTSDGNHTHAGTVASHTHSGTHSGTGSSPTVPGAGVGACTTTHTHSMSSSSSALAEASSNGAHTHDALTNDLEHRTIAFYKKTNTVIHMSRKSLPRNMTFFYSKTGTLPAGLLENLNYNAKHFKGDATPNTESGSNLHQHDSQSHTHPADISAHEHTYSFAGAVGTAGHGTGFAPSQASQGHGHGAGSAGTINKSSTPIDTGSGGGHQHDNITHEPAFKTLRLMEVNVLKMNQVGVPKNCIFLWLDTIALLNLIAGWQVSNGNNNTINMLAKFPKGSATPDTTGGSDTHTHSVDNVSHPHSGADVGHTHSPTGSSDATSDAIQINSAGTSISPNHAHSVTSVGSQAAQTITITNLASNHDHGSQNSEPDSLTVAFIERIVVA